MCSCTMDAGRRQGSEYWLVGPTNSGSAIRCLSHGTASMFAGLVFCGETLEAKANQHRIDSGLA